MKFTVVVPLFNKAPYISFTLQSVIAQTFSDFEVVVVDDGSRDNGADIVATLSQTDSRVRLIRQANGGVSAARNTGIQAAKGEWVAFLDADDWWHPDYLATQAAAIAAMPDVQVVATQLRRLPDADPWNPMPWPALAPLRGPDRITNLPERWMHGIPFFTSSIAVERVCLLAMQPCFAVGESHGEDLDVWFRLAEAGDIAHTPVALVAYRTEAVGSLSKAQAPGALAPYLHRMQIRATTGVLSQAKAGAAVRFIAQQHLSQARSALMAGERISALRSLANARGAALGKRWLLTAFMVLCVPSAWVARWEQWRLSRTGST